jgi:isopentenyl-diphosphate delta-isomerase
MKLLMEYVVLVDEQNNEVGTVDKETVHTANTPLHRGFSVFLFNSKNELLLTQRSHAKKTFPGVWTNTICGHPAPNETVIDGAKRRLKTELGLDITSIKEVAPYRYRFADQNGIVENEICPVLIAYTDDKPNPNPHEVAGWTWILWQDFLKNLKKNPAGFSPWCVEEAKLVSLYLDRV